MIGLYGRHYGARYEAIASLIPEGASVLDLCCGPAVLFHRYLRRKKVQYTGFDLNSGFIEGLVRRGGRGEVADLRQPRPLPAADYVIMQASLYHFLPDAAPIVHRMLDAAREEVIIAEPVRNVSSAQSPLVAKVAHVLTDPGNGAPSQRFGEGALDEFFAAQRAHILESFYISGGREKVYRLSRFLAA